MFQCVHHTLYKCCCPGVCNFNSNECDTVPAWKNDVDRTQRGYRETSHSFKEAVVEQSRSGSSRGIAGVVQGQDSFARMDNADEQEDLGRKEDLKAAGKRGQRYAQTERYSYLEEGRTVFAGPRWVGGLAESCGLCAGEGEGIYLPTAGPVFEVAIYHSCGHALLVSNKSNKRLFICKDNSLCNHVHGTCSPHPQVSSATRTMEAGPLFFCDLFHFSFTFRMYPAFHFLFFSVFPPVFRFFPAFFPFFFWSVILLLPRLPVSYFFPAYRFLTSSPLTRFLLLPRLPFSYIFPAYPFPTSSPLAPLFIFLYRILKKPTSSPLVWFPTSSPLIGGYGISTSSPLVLFLISSPLTLPYPISEVFPALFWHLDSAFFPFFGVRFFLCFFLAFLGSFFLFFGAPKKVIL